MGDRVQLGLSFLTRSLTLSCSSCDAPTPTLLPLDISLTLHTSDPGTHLQEGSLLKHDRATSRKLENTSAVHTQGNSREY